MWLLRLLPAETAHNVALVALRTGLWRPALVAGALIQLAWSCPLAALQRRLERSG